MISQEYLKENYIYKDGKLISKVKNKPIGTINGRGYYIVGINNKSYRVHRLIFLYHHGYLPSLIDHKDRNRLNNCIENLREATSSQNNHNRTGMESNTGYPGIHWSNSRQFFKAAFTHNKVYYYVGIFKDLQEAVTAYKKKYTEIVGEEYYILYPKKILETPGSS
jgi:hypothetical protein